jgi:RIO kinase 2
MEKVDGVELSRAKLPDEQVRPLLGLVLAELAAAYDAGYVHADMSEYNLFVTDEGVVIFDWPQAVATDHANADELLERDVENLLGYFRRKYPSLIGEADVPALAAAVREGSVSIDDYVE